LSSAVAGRDDARDAYPAGEAFVGEQRQQAAEALHHVRVVRVHGGESPTAIDVQLPPKVPSEELEAPWRFIVHAPSRPDIVRAVAQARHDCVGLVASIELAPPGWRLVSVTPEYFGDAFPRLLPAVNGVTNDQPPGEALIDAVERANASLRADGAGGADIREGKVRVWGGPPGRAPACLAEAENFLAVDAIRDETTGESTRRWLRTEYVEAMERWVRNPDRYEGLGGPAEFP
jgi:hypothetical protein